MDDPPPSLPEALDMLASEALRLQRNVARVHGLQAKYLATTQLWADYVRLLEAAPRIESG